MHSYNLIRLLRRLGTASPLRHALLSYRPETGWLLSSCPTGHRRKFAPSHFKHHETCIWLEPILGKLICIVARLPEPVKAARIVSTLLVLPLCTSRLVPPVLSRLFWACPVSSPRSFSCFPVHARSFSKSALLYSCVVRACRLLC